MLLFITICLVSSVVAQQICNEERCIQCIDIDVYFHAVAFTNETLFFNETQYLEDLPPKIEANIRVLNHEEFNKTPFLFVSKNSDQHASVVYDNNWTINMCEWSVRFALNRWSFLGDYDKSINVYLGHKMYQTSNASACASFPFYPINPIMMNYEVLPPDGTGLCLPHEVGHWLGLWHVYTETFKQVDDPCGVQNPGDFVDDIPLQLSSPLHYSYTNQTRWDFCPGQLGEDSFWNLMNEV